MQIVELAPAGDRRNNRKPDLKVPWVIFSRKPLIDFSYYLWYNKYIEGKVRRYNMMTHTDPKDKEKREIDVVDWIDDCDDEDYDDDDADCYCE